MSEEKKLARLANTFALTVGTSVIRLVHKNPSRKGLLVYNNTSGRIIYILSRQNLTASDGIPVVYQATYSNDDCYGELWIVSDGANTNVRVEEDTD